MKSLLNQFQIFMWIPLCTRDRTVCFYNLTAGGRFVVLYVGNVEILVSPHAESTTSMPFRFFYFVFRAFFSRLFFPFRRRIVRGVSVCYLSMMRDRGLWRNFK